MDERLIKLFFLIGTTITLGWFVTLTVFPFLRVDYQAPPEINIAMTALIAALAGLLGGAYFKARHPTDESDEERSDGDDTDDR
jgi:hypothetical protein